MTSYKLDKRIVELLPSQLPDFIKEDYDGFMVFIGAYFEWLETKLSFDDKVSSSDGIYNTTVNLKKYLDLDTTVDSFEEYFRKEFLKNIPKDILCDRRKLLKNIKNFYRARGTEKSYQLLFRILFKDLANFYYPIEDTLIADGGTWIEEKSLHCTFYHGYDFNIQTAFVGNRIYGMSSSANGVVEKVYTLYDDKRGIFIHEVFFEKNSIEGTFQPYELISPSKYSNERLYILPVITGIKLSYGGEGYSLTDEIIIDTGSEKVSALAEISEVDSTTGEILTIDVLDPSYGFLGIDTSFQDSKLLIEGIEYPVGTILATEDDNYIITDSAAVAPSVIFVDKGIYTAQGEIILGALFEYPGKYLNTDGFLDSIEHLRDDYFYQEFSYSITTSTPFVYWKDIIKKLVHPAGLIVFCNLLIQPEIVKAGIKNSYTYTKIVCETQSNKETFVPDKSLLFKIIDVNNKYIGPNLNQINKDAFKYIPSQSHIPNLNTLPMYSVTNSNYWDGYSEYSLENVGDFSLDDLLYKLEKKIDLEPRISYKLDDEDTVSPIFIFGTVHGASPDIILNGVKIELFDINNNPLGLFCYTDFYGNYMINLSYLIPGIQYKIKAIKEGLRFAPIEYIIENTGTNIEHQDFSLITTCSIEGVVTDG